MKLHTTIFTILLFLSPPGDAPASEVVVYCALDQPYSEPVIQRFEKETGIKVKTVHDSEAVKTAGLVNRILAESRQPRCDVFWNNEKLRTVLLAKKNCLAAYHSPTATQRKLPHDEKEGFWHEFAARCRVMVYHPSHVTEIRGQAKAPPLVSPENLQAFHLQMQLHDERDWLRYTPKTLQGKVAMAHPLFGTTSTQLLDWMRRARAGGEKTGDWLQKFMNAKPMICMGNSDVVRKVAAGDAYLGFTDSDDALHAIQKGVKIRFFAPQLAHRSGDLKSIPQAAGPLLIPNTIAIIRQAPHRKNAERFVEFILSEATEKQLAQCPSGQIPLGTMESPIPSSLPAAQACRNGEEEKLIKTLEADFELLRSHLIF